MEKVNKELLQQDINAIRGYVFKYILGTKAGSSSDEAYLRVLTMADKAYTDTHNLYLAYDELVQKSHSTPTNNLQTAAQAVLDRWNSPKWEWHKNGPTADLMYELRLAIEEKTRS